MEECSQLALHQSVNTTPVDIKHNIFPVIYPKVFTKNHPYKECSIECYGKNNANTLFYMVEAANKYNTHDNLHLNTTIPITVLKTFHSTINKNIKTFLMSNPHFLHIITKMRTQFLTTLHNFCFKEYKVDLVKKILSDTEIFPHEYKGYQTVDNIKKNIALSENSLKSIYVKNLLDSVQVATTQIESLRSSLFEIGLEKSRDLLENILESQNEIINEISDVKNDHCITSNNDLFRVVEELLPNYILIVQHQKDTMGHEINCLEHINTQAKESHHKSYCSVM